MSLPPSGPQANQYVVARSRVAEALSAKGFPDWTSTSFVDLWDPDDAVDVLWLDDLRFDRDLDRMDYAYQTLAGGAVGRQQASGAGGTGRRLSDVECLVRDVFVDGEHVSREIIRCYRVCETAVSCGGGSGSGGGEAPAPETQPYLWDMDKDADLSASLVDTRIRTASSCDSWQISTPDPYDGVATYNVYPTAYTRVVDLSFPASAVTYQDTEVEARATWNNSLMWSDEDDGYRSASVSGVYGYEHEMEDIAYHHIVGSHRALASLTGLGEYVRGSGST